MAKQQKPSNTQNAKTAVKTDKIAAENTQNWALPPFFQQVWLQCGLIFGLALLLYANTLGHGFVLDDGIVISDNMFTQKGVEGIPGILSKDTFFGYFKVEGKETLVSGGRYRPFTLVIFALMFQVFGASPFWFHLLTIVLFGLTCVMFYQTLRLLFAARLGTEKSNLFAWIAALLFTAHPIHTEAVANIKGCDEIVTLLLSLCATWIAIKAFRTNDLGKSILAGVVFFAACLSKENAAAYVLVLPLALWYSVAEGEQNVRDRILKTALPIWAAFVAFFVLRGEILDWRFGSTPRELMNNPFLKIEGNSWVDYTFAEKLAHSFYTLMMYVKLLFVPHPLTHDYYPPQISVRSFGNPVALFSLVFYLFLGYLAIKGLKKRTPLSFGLWAYLLPLGIVANILFPIGTSMGERFVFMPSAGFCIVVAALLFHFVKNWQTSVGIAAAVAALFALKTVTRNPVWKSNTDLFLSDVQYSPNSAKMQNACAGTYFDLASKEEDPTQKEIYLRRSVEHSEKALKLHPTYTDVQLTNAAAYYHLKDYERAVNSYRRLLQIDTDNAQGKSYLGVALRDLGKYYGEKKNDLPNALRCLNESWQLTNNDPETARLLGVAYGVQSKHVEALQWFTKASELAPNNASLLFELGNAYLFAGDLAKGRELQEKAIKMDPEVAKKRGQ